MNKKVAILTLFNNNNNYGGMLQAYALYQTVKKLGFHPIEINYAAYDNSSKRQFIIMNLKKLCNPFKFYKTRRKSIKYKKLKDKYVEYIKKRYGKDIMQENFERFRRDNFFSTPQYNRYSIKELQDVFVCAIVGGDQVWNPLYNTENFFLKNIKAKHKISYSASIGKDVLSKKEARRLVKGAQQLDRISVRETQAYSFFMQNGVECKVVADPVCLLSKEEWMKLAQLPHISAPYVFAYLLGEDEERRKQVRKYADKNEKEVVMISHVFQRLNAYDERYADITLPGISPFEFLGLIVGADCIITDSFHGTLFSIIFEKQFYCFDRDNRKKQLSTNSRIVSIVELLGLENRYIMLDKLADMRGDIEIDYSDCREKMHIFRNESLKYLSTELAFAETKDE